MHNDKKRKDISISNDKEYTRCTLAQKVPLDTPYSLDFEPSTYCNIKCIFCCHSSVYPGYLSLFNKKAKFENIKKVVDDLRCFPQKLKVVHFCGMGEPLSHPDIAKMIKYVKDANVTEKIDMVTNGILLRKTLADKIINSGLDFLRISLNGLSDEDFKEYTKSKVNFDDYVKNLKYFYENKKNTKIYLKILNFMIDTEEKKNFFYKTFEPICDVISIENYNECFLDTEGKNRLTSTGKNHRGETSTTAFVCSQPFFKIFVDVEGRIRPCPEPRFPFSLGNAYENSIVDMWNGKPFNDFRLEMLNGRLNSNDICKTCKSILINSYLVDDIDSEIERLKKYYKGK